MLLLSRARRLLLPLRPPPVPARVSRWRALATGPAASASASPAAPNMYAAVTADDLHAFERILRSVQFIK
jgi:hypothetical protein